MSSRGPQAPTSKLHCRVDDCKRRLSREKEYYRRFRCCPTHAKQPQVLVDGQLVRWCQQCCNFQPLAAFDGVHRSCREQLAHHNARRSLQRLAAARAPPPEAPPLRPHERELRPRRQDGGALREQDDDSSDGGHRKRRPEPEAPQRQVQPRTAITNPQPSCAGPPFAPGHWLSLKTPKREHLSETLPMGGYHQPLKQEQAVAQQRSFQPGLWPQQQPYPEAAAQLERPHSAERHPGLAPRFARSKVVHMRCKARYLGTSGSDSRSYHSANSGGGDTGGGCYDAALPGVADSGFLSKGLERGGLDALIAAAEVETGMAARRQSASDTDSNSSQALHLTALQAPAGSHAAGAPQLTTDGIVSKLAGGLQSRSPAKAASLISMQDGHLAAMRTALSTAGVQPSGLLQGSGHATCSSTHAAQSIAAKALQQAAVLRVLQQAYVRRGADANPRFVPGMAPSGLPDCVSAAASSLTFEQWGAQKGLSAMLTCQQVSSANHAMLQSLRDSAAASGALPSLPAAAAPMSLDLGSAYARQGRGPFTDLGFPYAQQGGRSSGLHPAELGRGPTAVEILRAGLQNAAAVRQMDAGGAQRSIWAGQPMSQQQQQQQQRQSPAPAFAPPSNIATVHDLLQGAPPPGHPYRTEYLMQAIRQRSAGLSAALQSYAARRPATMQPPAQLPRGFLSDRQQACAALLAAPVQTELERSWWAVGLHKSRDAGRPARRIGSLALLLLLGAAGGVPPGLQLGIAALLGISLRSAAQSSRSPAMAAGC